MTSTHDCSCKVGGVWIENNLQGKIPLNIRNNVGGNIEQKKVVVETIAHETRTLLQDP